MRTRSRSVRLALVGAALLTLAQTLFAASTVRGRLLRQGPGGQYPAAGVQVTVYAVGSRLGRSAPAYSGSDGMYYLYNIPGGAYQLDIWMSQRQHLTYNISVRNDGFTDIAPIVIP